MNPAPGIFYVRYSNGEPGQRRVLVNSFDLRGPGRLVVDADFLRFESEAGAGTEPPRIPRSHVANVDYDPDSLGFVIRSSHSSDVVELWIDNRADADALWELLPRQKTAGFLAEEEVFTRFQESMEAIGHSTPVTVGLIALNVAMFALAVVTGGDLMHFNSALLVRLGSNFGPLTWSGDSWRLISSVFLHGGLLHIALNMYALYQGGGLVERLFGNARFALIYLLAALAGGVASGWWDPTRNSVGASGAIFGVYGALLAFLLLRRADFPRELWKGVGSSALAFCGYSLVLGAISPVIDNTAHVGGLLGGFVAGLLLARPLTREARARPQPARLAIAAVVVAVPLGFLAYSLIPGGGPGQSQFQKQYNGFVAADTRLREAQLRLLTPAPNVGLDRRELARRLQAEILQPWREAARPLMEAPPFQQRKSHEARLQMAIQDYCYAKQHALELRIVGLNSGAEYTSKSADEAWLALESHSQHVNSIAAAGTTTSTSWSQLE